MVRYKARKQKPYAKWEFSETRITPRLNYKVAPSQPAPVIRIKAGEPDLTMMNFGWVGGVNSRQLMARGETVDEKRMFSQAFKALRCILLVNGFYDSVNMGKFRQPHHLHRKDDEMMGFAALWEERPDADNFCILSCVPNQVVRPVIDRMPVILPEDAWERWLDARTPAADLKALLVPYPADLMEAYPVTREVNKPGFNGPECIEKIKPEQPEFKLDLF